MSVFLRVLLVLFSVGTLILMIRKIRKSKLQIEHAIFWIVFLVSLIVLAIVPQVVFVVADWLQFMAPENMVFLVVIFVLLMKVFYQTVEIATLQHKLEELVQKIALDERDREKD